MNGYDYAYNSLLRLKNFCEAQNYKGWDPYDGLNSPFYKYNPFKYIRFFRLLWIQFFKRFPVNLRKIFLIKKGYNPKGLGLFLTSYCNLYKREKKKEYLETIHFLAEKIISLQTKGFSGACWGYNFDWQSRVFFLPKYTPTVVASSFVAQALLDAYDITGKEEYLKTGLSTCDFIIKDLNRTIKKRGFIFSYSPKDHTRVINASLLGSRLLSRAYSYTKDENLITTARESVIACTDTQRENGAWIYGEDKIQQWVDSFHTGYKLEAISEYRKYSGDHSFDMHIEKGLKYYMENFFLEDGTPKYYDNKTYPIDIHCPAQLFVTLQKMDRFREYKETAEKVLKWTIENMQNKKKCYFYFQIKPGKSSKIPFMRWGQAWMMYGMSYYLLGNR